MPEEDRTEREVDLASLSLNVNMTGITLAIFTFLLFFLYPTSAASSHPILLQLTLGLNIAAIFSFAISGLYNYVLVYSRPVKHAKLPTHTRRASWFFAVGLFTLLMEPALILFMIDQYTVAIVSVAFLILYALTYLSESNTIERIRRSGRPSSR